MLHVTQTYPKIILDVLNEEALEDKDAAGRALKAYPQWRGGLNNVVFNMLPGDDRRLGVPHGRAMVAGAGMDDTTYRSGFDISLPTFSPFVQLKPVLRKSHESRKWTMISSQINVRPDLRVVLNRQLRREKSFLNLAKCPEHFSSKNDDTRCDERTGKPHEYPEVLNDAAFCLILPGARLTQTTLMDAMHFGCIPVIAVDSLVLPFSEVLDWKRFSVRIFEHELKDLPTILGKVSSRRQTEMASQLKLTYERHFSTIAAITTTALDILNDRLFQHHSKNYFDWNPVERASVSLQEPQTSAAGVGNPLVMPHTPPAEDGFTAVILTYDRLESLFTVMTRVAEAPSLAKVLVVWNNQVLEPPPLAEWPKLPKPFQVVRTSANVLSNRFFPYDEIKTECILSIDDDIVMLTADELEFGYQVWREFPDRIVGFPSRTHVWNNATDRWKYESEWTSEISMVLTGAAFYHKYYNYLYTSAPTQAAKDIRKWVDDNMNCEDIAMNFLVANETGKAPVKVAPRKKFRCSTPQCANAENALSGMLASHMIERSDCINAFAAKYGGMPLKTVEFRADPVLYKDAFPEKLKRFNNLGSL